MIKPDVIMCWPRSCDYPIFRQYIHENRDKFNEIIVVFTESNYGLDYKEFLRENLFKDHVMCIENAVPGPGEDWRNIAIHKAMLHSYNAPWILFIEQDFTVNDGFWEKVEKLADEGHDAIGVLDRVRIHPCFLLIKRETLQRTCKNFGIVKDQLDHFGLIQKDIETATNNIKFGVIPDSLYHHMNGLSQNMYLLENGQVPNWNLAEFKQYMSDCCKVTVPLDSRFVDLANRAPSVGE